MIFFGYRHTHVGVFCGSEIYIESSLSQFFGTCWNMLDLHTLECRRLTITLECFSLIVVGSISFEFGELPKYIKIK